VSNELELDVPTPAKEEICVLEKGQVKCHILRRHPSEITLDDAVALCDIYLSLCVTMRVNPSGLLEGRMAQYKHEQAVLRSLRGDV
jgi:hypothetical protein